ncbi:MAG: class I SAM-dependent methyltransferase [Prevotellaceae bacterium]|jgi:predicted O-methyltransferase YrrM|nr:class I SAM-dependent methyltransferase [Prevotellaceae bacterium]
MKIEEYCVGHSTAENELLQELVRYTHLHVMHPRMLSGHLQGRLLSMMSQMLCPRRVLEIGAFTGYSTLCLAQGLTTDGILHSIERNDELEDVCRKFILRSHYAPQIQLHIGNALEVIPTLDENFDLVFIDGDKREYTDYFYAVIDKVRSGGFIIADNVLWNGKVLEEHVANDAQTQGIIKFNDIIQHDARVENLLLPLRDGLMVCRKL